MIAGAGPYGTGQYIGKEQKVGNTAASAMEIVFNLLYLISIYILVINMYSRSRKGMGVDRGITGPFLFAFLLLAIGDTGHVGFRVAAFALGGLEENGTLVGLGTLATAVTVTVFYMLIAQVHCAATKGSGRFWYWSVIGLGAARLIFMTLPGNKWGQVVPPMGFSYARNIFLTVMGLIVAVMMLTRSTPEYRRFSRTAAVCIFISFGFYIPVILFIRSVPILGMLMIPKTLAYIALAVIGRHELFSTRLASPVSG